MGAEEEFVGTHADQRADLLHASITDNEVKPHHTDDTRIEKDVKDQSSSYKIQSDEISYQYLTFQTEIATQPVWPNDILSKSHLEVPNYQQYDDPLGWSLTRKRWMTYLACSVNVFAAYAAGAYASPADTLIAKWRISRVSYNLGIAIFTYGFALAPMILAPFSEISGRRPVFIVSGILFVICQMGCAVTESFGGMIVARLFLGVGGSTFSTMVGGILADIWATADRNGPMVLFSGFTLLGTGLGPLFSGFIAQRLLWRWVFYVQIIFSGVIVALVTIFFKETRGSVLLSRKAKILNTYYANLEGAGALGIIIPNSELALVSTGASTPPRPDNEHIKPKIGDDSVSIQSPTVHRLRYRVKSDEERESLLKMISLSLYRPIHLLFTEPVVFWFSLWISFAWAVLYLQFGSIPLVFRVNHNFTLEQTGAIFTSICVAGVVMTPVAICQERWALSRFPQRIGGSPEGRLYFACVESAFLPLGLFMFGWTCYSSIHWIVPTIAIAFMTIGIFSIFLAVFNYTADVYRIYASSALAASGMCRNLLAGSFSLVSVQMFEGMGFQAASSLLGGIGLVLTFVPWVLVFFGPRIRARSRIAVNFLTEEEKIQLGRRTNKDEETASGSGHGDEVTEVEKR